MDIIIENLKIRALDEKLCEFLKHVDADILTDFEVLQILIEAQSFDIDFEVDERDDVRIAILKAGKKYTYTFHAVDFDSIHLQ